MVHSARNSRQLGKYLSMNYGKVIIQQTNFDVIFEVTNLI